MVSDRESVILIALDNARRSERNEYIQESGAEGTPTFYALESAYSMTAQ